MPDLTYSDGAELLSGDAALLRELEQRVESAKSKFKRHGLTQDYHDMLDALQAVRGHCRKVLAEGCSECDEHGEVVAGWTPPKWDRCSEAIYAACPTCAKRIDEYLKEND